MASRDTRREENQKLFRRGNERLRDVAVAAVGPADPIPFLCECAADDCNGRVEVTNDEWESIAAQSNRYLMVSGHERSEGERVVGHVAEYEVVEKPA
jgi:hypothetical protein